MSIGLLALAALPVSAGTADDAVRSGDRLLINVWNQPSLSGPVTVEDDGAIAFPLIGRVQASGRTLRELEAELAARLSAGFVIAPQVRVQIERRAGRVFVLGEIRAPGSYRLTPGLTVAEALAVAGWVTAHAGPEAVVLRGGADRKRGETPDVTGIPVANIDISTVEGLAAGGTFPPSDGDTILVRPAPTVHVIGPVLRPGEYAIHPDARVMHALSSAGGLRQDASDQITIIRSVDGTAQSRDAQPATPLAPGDVVVVGERGALRLKPRVGLVNFGYDSNIHHSALVPQDDIVATLRGGLEAAARTPHLVMEANGRADLEYFQQHHDQRSVNVVAHGRLEAPVSRLTPHAEAAYDRGLAREQFDMHRRLFRTVVRGEAGGSFAVTRDTALGASAGHRRVDFVSTGSDLDSGTHSLDRDEDRVLLSARTAVTTQTTVGLTAFGERARFRSAYERDSTTLAYLPVVTFGRDAAVSGSVSAGYKQVTFVVPALRNFRGAVADVGLSRGLSERTQLTLSGLRDFRFSADRVSGYYVFSSAGAGVRQWLSALWRMEVSAEYKWLEYDAVPGSVPRTDHGYVVATRVGRRIEATTFEVGVAYELRHSRLVRESFNALVVGMSVIYAP